MNRQVSMVHIATPGKLTIIDWCGHETLQEPAVKRLIESVEDVLQAKKRHQNQTTWAIDVATYK